MEIINKLGKIRIIDFIIEFLLNRFFSFSRRWFRQKSNGNVVVISLHKLGDTVFTIPAIKKIIAQFSVKNVFVLTFPESKELYRLVLSSANLIPIEKSNFIFGGRISNKKVKAILNNLLPGIIFDLTGSIASASLIAFSNANRIIGMNTKYCKNIYDNFIPIRQKPHLMDRYLEVVDLHTPLCNEKISKEFAVNFNVDQKIILHPFAGWKAKEWNLNKFIKLAILLNEQYDLQIIAPEHTISKDVVQETEKVGLIVSFTKAVSDLINEIKNCSVLISNDSGPVYIANILGKATFSIYGPTEPRILITMRKVS